MNDSLKNFHRSDWMKDQIVSMVNRANLATYRSQGSDCLVSGN